MVKVTKSKDCGNSPKNKFVQDVAIAISTGEIDALSSLVAENIEWIRDSKSAVNGRKDFIQALQKVKVESPAELEIQHVVSHGKVGAATGVLRKRGGEQVQFCHVLEFTSAAAKGLKKISSYVLR